MSTALPFHRHTGAFTLMEMMLALAVAAAVLATIGTVFMRAIDLRARTIAVTERMLPLDRGITTIKRDLVGIMPPGTNQGTMIGVMGTDATAVGVTQPLILEFFTTTGAVQDDVPWGDMQKIDYWLQDPSNKVAGSTGKDLIRGVTRNLLATIPDSPEQQVVLSDVDNMHMSFYDGTNWNPTWSTTLSNVPSAIKVFLKFTSPKTGGSAIPPIQFVEPVVIQPPGTDTNSATVSN